MDPYENGVYDDARWIEQLLRAAGRTEFAEEIRNMSMHLFAQREPGYGYAARVRLQERLAGFREYELVAEALKPAGFSYCEGACSCPIKELGETKLYLPPKKKGRHRGHTALNLCQKCGRGAEAIFKRSDGRVCWESSRRPVRLTWYRYYQVNRVSYYRNIVKNALMGIIVSKDGKSVHQIKMHAWAQRSSGSQTAKA